MDTKVPASVRSASSTPRRSSESQKPTASDELKWKLQSLQLSRRRVATELENARTDVHRAALRAALAHLDQEIGKLGS